MAARFDGAVGAFAYLLFILLYFPCVATIGAIVRETSLAWAAFVAAWTTGVAFAASTGFYQAATFARHPLSSGAWLLGLALALGLVIAGLRYLGPARGPGPSRRPRRDPDRYPAITWRTEARPAWGTSRCHLDADPEAVRGMLEHWMRKGRVRRHLAGAACGGCSQCEGTRWRSMNGSTAPAVAWSCSR